MEVVQKEKENAIFNDSSQFIPHRNDSGRDIKKSCENCIPKRLIFVLIGFLATTLSISLNTNLSLAIVAMVDRSNESSVQIQTSNECLTSDLSISNFSLQEEPIRKQGEFKWSPETEGMLIGCLYYGQLVGVLPGGRMAELYGGKRTIIGFLLLASSCTVVAPFAARISIYLFAACRFLVGVGTAPVIPVLFYLLSRWIPETERSLSASVLLAGYGVGTFVSFITAGALCASNILGGWPSVFYFGGICGFLWCAMSYFLIYEKPLDHPEITDKELKYIAGNLGPTEQKQIKKIPWKSIMKSKAFWSLAIGYFGQFWILGFFCSVQALYMGTILNIDSKMTGELSSWPHLIRGLFACVCGYPADWALKRSYVSKEAVRKGATAINSIFACLGFVAIIAAGCDPVLNTVFFTLGGLLGDFVTFGVCMAGVDIAPNLSGTLSAVLNIIGVVPFFVIPALVGFFTKHERSRAQWRSVYYIIIGVVAVSTLVFVLFGTSEPQTWGTVEEEIENKEKENEKEQNLKYEKQPDTLNKDNS